MSTIAAYGGFDNPHSSFGHNSGVEHDLSLNHQNGSMRQTSPNRSMPNADQLEQSGHVGGKKRVNRKKSKNLEGGTKRRSRKSKTTKVVRKRKSKM